MLPRALLSWMCLAVHDSVTSYDNSWLENSNKSFLPGVLEDGFVLYCAVFAMHPGVYVFPFGVPLIFLLFPGSICHISTGLHVLFDIFFLFLSRGGMCPLFLSNFLYLIIY